MGIKQTNIFTSSCLSISKKRKKHTSFEAALVGLRERINFSFKINYYFSSTSLNRFSHLDLGLRSGMETVVIGGSRHSSQIMLLVMHSLFHMEVPLILQFMHSWREIHILEDNLQFYLTHHLPPSVLLPPWPTFLHHHVPQDQYYIILITVFRITVA